MDVLGPNETNVSVMRPYGVFAVISPFNFPLALAGGPSGGALVAGNTVVFKPATDTRADGREAVRDGRRGRPAEGRLQLHHRPGPHGRPGDDRQRGDRRHRLHRLDGSRDEAAEATTAARKIPRPVIIEMGGKNPAIITSKADLDKASDGVFRSAFGAQGQKCSACSRVYVSKDVRDRFVQMLVEKTRKIKIGNPLEKDVWMGPVVNEGALKTFEDAVARAKAEGAKILCGGNRIMTEPWNHGYFVEPTLIESSNPGQLPVQGRVLRADHASSPR